MIYLSAGHSLSDPGAPAADGRTEAAMTRELRDRTLAALAALGITKIVRDVDTESLAQYLARIQPGEGSVVCEIHFNAAENRHATGVEVVIPDRHTAQETAIASRICDVFGKRMQIANRGVKTERETHRGTLGIMREAGINILIEVCFISNPDDLKRYDMQREGLALDLAKLLKEADEYAA